jgi:uncharacterized membrane-anchored protein
VQTTEATTIQQSSMSDQAYENAMIEAFVNKPEKTLWYQNAFSKFNINGVDSMKWVWSWWALSGGWAFLLYRKQYLAAVVLFFISTIASFIPLLSLIVAIFTGGFSTFFIYKGYKQKKAEIEASIEDTQKRIETMREVGGYNQWVVWVYILFSLITMLIFAVLLAPLLTQG